MNESTEISKEPERALTIKSVLFGLLGICLISGLAGFHDSKISFWPPLVGMHLPIGAFFYMFVIGVVWNGFWSKYVPALTLSSRELLVVMVMTLMACFPPTSGLFRYFHRQLVLPWYYLSTGGRTEWEKFDILGYLPAKLFPHPAPSFVHGIVHMDENVYNGFFTGLAQGASNIGLREVPFAAWLGPLVYWGPLIILTSITVMALYFLVHQQWAHHEQLSYPLAQVASSFVRREKGRGLPDLFRSRLFWWGFTPVFTLYGVDYLHQWFPEYVPGLSVILPNIKSWTMDWNSKFPILYNVPSAGSLSHQIIFFAVIGLAYFVSSEISLTMGLSSIMLAIAASWFFTITGTPLAANDLAFSYSGAYIGYGLILLYTGRAYYWPVFRKAFTFQKALTQESTAVFAARILVIASAGLVATLVIMGLDWFIAILFSLTLMLLFLVFTRIICETGIPFMQAGWAPASMLVSLMGPAALGPGPIVYVFYLSTILCQDPRECLMPFVATSVKMADDAGLRIRRFFWILLAAVVIALGVAFVSSSWTLYNFGSMSSDVYSYKMVPLGCFDDATREISQLNDTGLLKQSAALSGFAKLKLLSPDPSAVGYVVFGILAVAAFSLLRFRFTGFPLHPVLFIVWGTYPASLCWASFLIGYGIKVLIVRFGGGKVAQELKPLFVGLIAGELIAAGASIFVEMIYYYVQGHVSGIDFIILPG